jgi:glutaminyl-tRNA synthetase
MGPSKGTSAVSPETAAYVDLFKSVGLTQAKAAEAAKNAKSAVLFQGLIERHSLTGVSTKSRQDLLPHLQAVQAAKIGEDEY